MHEPAIPRNTSLTPSAPRRALVALVLANVFLAFGPWLVRLADTGPVAAAFWRLTLALPLLVLLTAISKQPWRPTGKHIWFVLALSGLFFALDLASWHIGILQTKLANATLFGNSTSLILPVYGFLVARAWPNRWEAAALALAGLGTALLMGRSYELSPGNLVGDLFCVAAGVLYTGYLVAMTRVRLTLGALPALAWSTLAGIAPLLVIALALGERVLPQDWSALLLLALVSQVAGQGLMIYALGQFPPIVIGLALLVQPIVAGTVGWWVYDERLGALDFLGAAAIAVALVLVRREVRPRPARLA